MKTMANTTFENLSNRRAAQARWRMRLEPYFKRLVFLVFIAGLSVFLEILALEIPNRFSVFPLYGFWAFSAAAATALAVYLFNPARFFKRSMRAAGALGETRPEIPAVTMIIRRRKIERQKTETARAGR